MKGGMGAESFRSFQKGEIHVWRVSLSPQEKVIEALKGLLDTEERGKSARFLFAKDRARYIITHGALRTILSGYMRKPPQSMLFGRGRFGKPHLAEEQTQLHFNMSHCEDLALIAVSADTPLGVDVERLREIPELESMLERYFTAEERMAVMAAEAPRRIGIFLGIWTRREAAAKAMGLDLDAALSLPGAGTFLPGADKRIESVGEVVGNAGDGGKWWVVKDLGLDAEHVGAICAAGDLWGAGRVLVRDFEGIG